MAETEKPKKRYYYSLTKNDLLDFMPNYNARCLDFQKNFYKCVDRVGLQRGSVDCSVYLEDLRECKYPVKQTLRMKAIGYERRRQNRPPVPPLAPDAVKSQNNFNTERM